MTPAFVDFVKYQALGNDYLVLVAEAAGALAPASSYAELRPEFVRRVCDRHLGVGSDGILVEDPQAGGGIGLRIYNPDGSEAEKSGNGLRIFARYLWDSGRVAGELFEVATAGGVVRCRVLDGGSMVHVEMGRACFDSERIPVAGPPREVVGETVEVAGETVCFTAVTVGNPHCVVHREAVTRQLAERLGPLLENHLLFPNRTNVQFVQVLDRHRLKVEIWERGAGYTLASGSSSCAAAAASVRLGLCDGDVRVEMPGGSLDIGVGAGFELTMLGPVERVASGRLSEELLAHARE
jgi:diaminopimelate epimerase